MMFIFFNKLWYYDTKPCDHRAAAVFSNQPAFENNWPTLMAFGIFWVTSHHSSIYKAKLSHPVSPPRPDSPARLDYKCLGEKKDSETQNLPKWWTASSSSNQRKQPNPAARRTDLKVRLALSLSLDMPVAAVGLFLEIMFRTSQRVQELFSSKTKSEKTFKAHIINWVKITTTRKRK